MAAIDLTALPVKYFVGDKECATFYHLAADDRCTFFLTCDNWEDWNIAIFYSPNRKDMAAYKSATRNEVVQFDLVGYFVFTAIPKQGGNANATPPNVRIIVPDMQSIGNVQKLNADKTCFYATEYQTRKRINAQRANYIEASA